jgi:hypothetical protein
MDRFIVCPAPPAPPFPVSVPSLSRAACCSTRKMRWQGPPKHRQHSTGLHSVTSQKTTILAGRTVLRRGECGPVLCEAAGLMRGLLRHFETRDNVCVFSCLTTATRPAHRAYRPYVCKHVALYKMGAYAVCVAFHSNSQRCVQLFCFLMSINQRTLKHNNSGLAISNVSLLSGNF